MPGPDELGNQQRERLSAGSDAAGMLDEHSRSSPQIRRGGEPIPRRQLVPRAEIAFRRVLQLQRSGGGSERRESRQEAGVERRVRGRGPHAFQFKWQETRQAGPEERLRREQWPGTDDQPATPFGDKRLEIGHSRRPDQRRIGIAENNHIVAEQFFPRCGKSGRRVGVDARIIGIRLLQDGRERHRPLGRLRAFPLPLEQRAEIAELVTGRRLHEQHPQRFLAHANGASQTIVERCRFACQRIRDQRQRKIAGTKRPERDPHGHGPAVGRQRRQLFPEDDAVLLTHQPHPHLLARVAGRAERRLEHHEVAHERAIVGGQVRQADIARRTLAAHAHTLQGNSAPLRQCGRFGQRPPLGVHAIRQHDNRRGWPSALRLQDIEQTVAEPRRLVGRHPTRQSIRRSAHLDASSLRFHIPVHRCPVRGCPVRRCPVHR